jgi:hypothetical protein
MLRRLSHPHWFQSFGAVMGMDWHSSGITTSVIGALKCGLRARHPCLRWVGELSRASRHMSLSRKLGQSEELEAIRRLDEQARRLEVDASGRSVEALLVDERARSHQYGGRSVFGEGATPRDSVPSLR